MRIGIRTKLVILMVAVALLPLLAALITIVVGGRHLRRETVGQGILSVVSFEASVIQTELEKNIELLNKVALHKHTVLEELNNLKTKRPAKELSKLDREWPNLPAGRGPVKKVLRNPTAEILQTIMEGNNLLAEIMITDRFGQLIAATRRTSDFYQGDEEWWKKCYNDGRGRIYVSRISYDRSSKIWGGDLCIPVMAKGEVIGVAKAMFELEDWIPESHHNVAGGKAFLLILNDDGYILHGPGIIAGTYRPLEKRLADWEMIVPLERVHYLFQAHHSLPRLLPR